MTTATEKPVLSVSGHESCYQKSVTLVTPLSQFDHHELSSIMVSALSKLKPLSPLSQLTDSEEEEEEPVAEYKITRQLRAPRNTQYSTQSLLSPYLFIRRRLLPTADGSKQR
jgi:hypothetical protein